MSTVNVNDVMSVYSGRNAKCCCGCAGKHTTASQFRDLRSKSRGYPVSDNEVSNRTVTLVVNKINTAVANGAEVLDGDNHVAVTVGKRLYVAYLASKA